MNCEKIRVTFRDQSKETPKGIIKSSLVVKELEIEPEVYKPIHFGPILPISAPEVEIILGNWVRYII